MVLAWGDVTCSSSREGKPTTQRGGCGHQTIPDATTIVSDAINFSNRDGDNVSNANIGLSGVTDKSGQPGVQAAHSSSQCAHDEQLRSDSQMDSSLDPALLFPNPTFSLGLTQEAQGVPPNNTNPSADTVEEGGGEEHVGATIEEARLACRKSKRRKVPTKSLMGEYECDKGFLNRTRKAVTDAIYKGGNIDYAAKFAALMDKMKTPFQISTQRGNIQSTELYQVVERATQLSAEVVDVLMFHTSTLFRSQSSPNQQPSYVFMDTQFVYHFTTLYTKFSKVSKKDSFKFTGNVVDMLLQLPSHADALRFYFPFNLDKKYWVAICVDCSSWSVTVLDYNNDIRTDYMMNKEVRPIALMFPYLLKQVGRQLGSRGCKVMAIERLRTIPQQNAVTQLAVASVLFIQAHAVGGVDACKCITPDVLDSHVERLVVTLYETNVGPL
ncbi:hypothetical protein Bca52824_026736 [Brassica carinata]|uniref:Ubiquitin-like protease family profile domain-containing protein n=1 Tax=Brassica carinata TaxID=52824 RepID=A0A8X7SIJ1_BRACI|nr:hypothetical protein Bca52824_026736 [Brassica carinata]